MSDIQFSVTEAEAGTMLTALAQLPFIQVAGLMMKLQGQAQASGVAAAQPPTAL